MNVFDIIGPVMIGPSSSHTAGAVRLGRISRALLGKEPVRAEIQLHGSFAQTYHGHGTDKALIAGIMGMQPDDQRIRNSLELATKQGLVYSFTKVVLENAHPNTALIHLTAEDGTSCSLQGASVGGGNILVTRINGMAADFSGQYTTFLVLHRDKPGMIAEVARFMAEKGINIGTFRSIRTAKGGTAVMTLEVDMDNIPSELVDEIRSQPNILNCVMIHRI